MIGVGGAMGTSGSTFIGKAIVALIVGSAIACGFGVMAFVIAYVVLLIKR
jgi:hypothetical protein